MNDTRRDEKQWNRPAEPSSASDRPVDAQATASSATGSRTSSGNLRREWLEAILDTLIPSSEDGRMPAGGELGIADSVVAHVASLPEGGGILEGIVDAIEAAARSTGTPFLESTQEQRVAAVAAVSTTHAELFEALWTATLVAYYQHPRICQELGLRPGPPYPEGYEVADTNLSLLDPVRIRAPFWRGQG